MILNYEDVVLIPQKSVLASRSHAILEASLGKHIFACPVVPSNMPAILNEDICRGFDKDNWFYVYPRVAGVDDVRKFVIKANGQLGLAPFRVVSISVGIGNEWKELIRDLAASKWRVDYINVDIAHSHTDFVIPMLETIREYFPDVYLILGNGCTAEWVEWVESLKLVDCIQVGIGVSKACRTREYTGFGSSTLGSLRECNDAAKNLDIMSDGGLTKTQDAIYIGDVAKAIAFGADWVMSGALFSQCIDSPSVIHGYYGNASKEAKGDIHVEGELIKVETNGKTLSEMRAHIMHSLRSSVSYGGGRDIYDLFNTPYKIVK